MSLEDTERPDWIDPPDEEIPPSLQDKWQKDELKGKKAGVCKFCGWPFLEDELSCRHCGKPTEVTAGFLSSMYQWFTKTPWGIITFLIIVLAVFLLLTN